MNQTSNKCEECKGAFETCPNCDKPEPKEIELKDGSYLVEEPEQKGATPTVQHLLDCAKLSGNLCSCGADHLPQPPKPEDWEEKLYQVQNPFDKHEFGSSVWFGYVRGLLADLLFLAHQEGFRQGVEEAMKILEEMKLDKEVFYAEKKPVEVLSEAQERLNELLKSQVGI